MIWLRWIVGILLLFPFIVFGLFNARLVVDRIQYHRGPFFCPLTIYGGLLGMVGILVVPTPTPIKWWLPLFLDAGSLPFVALNLWAWRFGRWDAYDAQEWLRDMQQAVIFKVFAERLYIVATSILPVASLDDNTFVAAECGYDRLVSAWLKSGANPNYFCKRWDETTLKAAIVHCRSKTIRRLLESGASIDGIDPDGRDIGSPPLFIAVFVRSAPKIRLLLESGADAKVRVDGHSLLYWAKKRKLSRAGVELLRRAGAEPEPE